MKWIKIIKNLKAAITKIMARILSPLTIVRLWLTYLLEGAATMNIKTGSMILPPKEKFWWGRTVRKKS